MQCNLVGGGKCIWPVGWKEFLDNRTSLQILPACKLRELLFVCFVQILNLRGNFGRTCRSWLGSTSTARNLWRHCTPIFFRLEKINIQLVTDRRNLRVTPVNICVHLCLTILAVDVVTKCVAVETDTHRATTATARIV